MHPFSPSEVFGKWWRSTGSREGAGRPFMAVWRNQASAGVLKTPVPCGREGSSPSAATNGFLGAGEPGTQQRGTHVSTEVA